MGPYDLEKWGTTGDERLSGDVPPATREPYPGAETHGTRTGAPGTAVEEAAATRSMRGGGMLPRMHRRTGSVCDTAHTPEPAGS